MTFQVTANRRAFLWMIRKAEGTSGPNGYRTLYGGGLFTGYADHPRRLITKGGWSSTAAGAYQILERTWNTVQRALQLHDFTPASQDQAGLWLVEQRGGLDDVDAGRWEAAIRACRKEWASFPGAGYGQGERSMAFMLAAIKEGLGGAGATPTPSQQTQTPTGPPTAEQSMADTSGPVSIWGTTYDSRSSTPEQVYDDPLRYLQIDGIANPVDLVLSAEVSWSTSQVSQVTIRLADPTNGDIASSMKVGATRVLVGTWQFRVSALEIGPSASGGAEVTLTARSELAQQLRREPFVGPWTAQNLGYWQALSSVCKHVLAEVGPVRANVEVKGADTGGDQVDTIAKPESWWDASARWAAIEGKWRFECENTLFFGRPSWLAEKSPSLVIDWAGAPDDVILARPSIRATEDGQDRDVITTTVTLALHPRTAVRMRPGMTVKLRNLGANGYFLVTDISGNLRSVEAWTVSAQTIVDPKATGETSSSSTTGTSTDPANDALGGMTGTEANPATPGEPAAEPGAKPPSGAASAIGTGDYQQLLDALLRNPRVTFIDNGKREDYRIGGVGVNGAKTRISIGILRVLTDLAQRHTFTISSAISSHPQYVNGASSGRISPHKTGRGCDLNIIDGVHVAPTGAGLRKTLEIIQELQQMPAIYRPTQVSKPDGANAPTINGIRPFADGHHNDNLHFTSR